MKNSWQQIYESLLSSGILGIIAGTVRALIRPEETTRKTIAVWCASLLTAQLVGLVTQGNSNPFIVEYRDIAIGASALLSKEMLELLQVVMKDPYAYIANIKDKIKKS